MENFKVKKNNSVFYIVRHVFVSFSIAFGFLIFSCIISMIIAMLIFGSIGYSRKNEECKTVKIDYEIVKKYTDNPDADLESMTKKGKYGKLYGCNSIDRYTSYVGFDRLGMDTRPNLILKERVSSAFIDLMYDKKVIEEPIDEIRYYYSESAQTVRDARLRNMYY